MHAHHQIWRPVALMTALVAATLFATTTLVVAPGDTLSEIAASHDVTIAELVEWNDIEDPDRIRAGVTLVLVAPVDGSVPADDTSVVHVVTAGDTLSAIARRFGTSVAALAADNELTDPDRIFEGQTLVLGGSAPARPVEPTPTTHTVVPGDTLSRVAAANGVTVAALAAANDVDDVDRIVVGQVLEIPSGAAAPEEPAPEPPPVTTTTTAPPTEDTTVRRVDDVLLVPVFSRWADVYRVPQDLLEAIAWKESNWRPDAVGPGGHLGIMQFSPATVELIETGMLGRTVDPLDAEDAIQMGARYLRYLLDRTESEREAIAAWQQGLNGVLRDGVTTSGDRYADAVDEIRRQRG